MAGPGSRWSAELVGSNEDLLIEILVRLPVLSLCLFKPVSKHWYSLIKHVISLIKADKRNPDPPSGLYISKYSSNINKGLFNYNFVLLDTRIPLLTYNSFIFGPKHDNETRVSEIFDSCNGLLLYHTLYFGELHVYNPSITNMFISLPKPDNLRIQSIHYNHVYGGFKLAFDPTKSSHYKVIYAKRVGDDMVQIHTFSSETGNWSLCGHQFSQRSFVGFKFGVYWNDAICWSTGENVFNLDIMNEHPVLTAVTTPPNTIYRPSPIYLLFESRGCLLLVASNNILSRHCTIYEKRNVYSEWSVKYTVNLDDVAERCCHERIFGIVLGEREEDSFLVWRLGRKVVRHRIVSKTLSTISDLGPNDDLLGCFQFIPSFAHV